MKGIKAGADLVLTSGGTGFSPTDVTPEAVEPLITKHCHSLTQYMQTEAVRTITPLACLSRSVIGIINDSMVVCLPGKPKAVKENFEILTSKGVLQHALAQMKSQEKH